jgi:hypothetical protein
MAVGGNGLQNARIKNRQVKSDALDEKPVDSTRDEALQLLERLGDEYGDVKVAGRKTYGDLARVGLARLRPKTTYVLDHRGVIRYKNVHGEDMDRAVETLLEELAADSKERSGRSKRRVPG